MRSGRYKRVLSNIGTGSKVTSIGLTAGGAQAALFNSAANTVAFTTTSADNAALTLVPTPAGATATLAGTGAASFTWTPGTHELKLNTLPVAAATATLTFKSAGLPDRVVTVTAPVKP